MKEKGRLRKSQSGQAKETWQSNAMWDPALDPRTVKEHQWKDW